MIPALCTLTQIRTSCTDVFIALILFIAISIGRTILQYLIIRTDITIIVLIINVLVFLEEPLFGLWTLIWE